MNIKSLIRTIPDYPKNGIMFRDITTLLKDPVGLQSMMNILTDRYRNMNIDKVAGVEARGFIIGAPLAHQLGVGFIPIRKKGKLPSVAVGQDYELEYGTDRIEIHADAINIGERILLVDDLIATGGTAEAAIRLIQKIGGLIVECAFVINLPDVGGRQRLEELGHQVFALTEFEGE